MPKWVDKIIKYNHGEKSLWKAPFIIYLHLEFLLKKLQSYQNSYTERKAMHEPSD